MTMTLGIRCEALSKQFQGRFAVKTLDLDIPPGSVFGLLGPNGAGKTTTVRMLSTVIRPTSGTAYVAGMNILRDPLGVRRSIAVVSQGSDLNQQLTVHENCRIYLQMRGVARGEAKRRTDQVLEEFGLATVRDRTPRVLSGGQRRRTQVARVFASRAPIVFLDEPTAGLDPVAREQVMGRIQEASREGRTVLLTTQVLDEAEQLCTTVALLKSGEVAINGSVAQVRQEAGYDRVVISLRNANSAAIKGLLPIPQVNGAYLEGSRVVIESVDPHQVAPKALQVLVSQGYEIGDISFQRITLSDVYKKAVGG